MTGDFFRFEDKNYDFPFYNDETKITKKNIFILGLGLFISTLTPFIISYGKIHIFKGSIITLSTLIPVIYIFKDDLTNIFRIPKLKDILVIIIGIISMFILLIMSTYSINSLGISIPTNRIVTINPMIFLITATIQLIGEELLKFIVWILVMALSYKYVGRKFSIILGLFMSQICFALFHIPAYGFNLTYLLIVIGFGSLSLPLIYFRTKNIVLCYIVHLLYDLIAFYITILV